MNLRLLIGLALSTALLLPLAACGKKGPPRQPGPADKITYPRIYPMPE
jgi:predicted small lipoprotein YifL